MGVKNVKFVINFVYWGGGIIKFKILAFQEGGETEISRLFEQKIVLNMIQEIES